MAVRRAISPINSGKYRIFTQWTCIAGHPNWQDSTFAFTLEDRQGETLLRFVQEYAQELSDEIYGTDNFTWGYDLYSLQLLCETGTGTPFVPPSD